MRTFFAFGCAIAIEFRANKGMQMIAGHILAKNPHPPIQFDRSSSTLIRLLFIGPLRTNLHLLNVSMLTAGPLAQSSPVSPQGVLRANLRKYSPEGCLAGTPSSRLCFFRYATRSGALGCHRLYPKAVSWHVKPSNQASDSRILTNWR